MFRIAILYAGGTIGMRHSAQGFVPDTDFIDRLQHEAGDRLAKLALELVAEFQFEALEPLLDSAEAQPATWQSLANAVQSRIAHVDAVLLLHGTDTLAYTASALSFRLMNLGRAVVISGAQKPFGTPGSDAWSNLALALRTARTAYAHEVLVAFGGEVYRANRCTKWAAQADKAFHSPNTPALAKADAAGRLQWLESTARAVRLSPLSAPTAALVVGHPQLGVMHLHPGINISRWRSWMRAEPLDGLVLRGYGSGNAPVSSTALLDLLHEAREGGTLVVSISTCLSGHVDATYATATPLTQAGVQSGGDMTLECALTKLDWVCQRHTDLAYRTQEFNQVLCGERCTESAF